MRRKGEGLGGNLSPGSLGRRTIPLDKDLKLVIIINMNWLRTRQRQAILEAVQSTSEHPTASWIYQKVRRQIPRVSLGTVYRNLRLLQAEGLLSEIRIGERASRYEAAHQKHSHLYCRGCGRIQDLPILVDAKLERKAARLSRYTILEHSLEMWGICPSCQTRPSGRSLISATPLAEASPGSRISRKVTTTRTKLSSVKE